MTIIRAKAPLRISFCGGGTDIEPYLDEFGGCVLSTTINKYCNATLIPRNDNQVFIHSYDLDEVLYYSINSEPQHSKLKLIRMVIKNFVIPTGFNLYIKSDAPVGSGLGSSSSLVVCLISLFSKWLNIPFSKYEIAKLAYKIERNDMGIKGGYQDQYASVFGGINFIEFNTNKVIVNPLRIEEDILDELEHSLLLCYTGNTRKSEDIIKKQVNNYLDNITFLHELKQLTIETKEALLKSNYLIFGNCLHKGWNNKKKLTSEISNSYIDELYQIGLEAGSLGGKLLGAGGEGYLLFYCKNKENVRKSLESAGGEIVDFNFDYKGVRAWKI